MRERVAEIARAHPGSRLDVWAHDHHRLGLQPILRRVWGPRGAPVVVTIQPRYEWTWLDGWVRPTTGETYWLLLPWATIATATLALQTFANAVGAGPDKQVVLVVDQAGWHRSAALALPAGLRLVFLPAQSPELQLAERLWSLADEGLANRLFATLSDLHDTLTTRLQYLRTQLELIRSTTCYHWWPATG